MSRRIWLVTAAIVVVAIVVGGVTGFVLHRQHERPPQVAAGLYRFPATPHSDGRNPTYPPNVTVDGTPLLGLVDSISDGRADVQVKVGPLPTGTAADARTTAHRELAVGQHMTVSGFVITLVRVWQMPNADHNAVDVRITRAAT